MERRFLYVKSKFDGLPISVMECMPDGKPHAVVLLVHGLCGCKERFLPFMEYLTSNGLACVASDLRGHGSSIRNEADRGYMYGGGAEAVVADLDTVVDYIDGRFNGHKLVMLGHSMGSLAARVYVKHHDDRLSGLVLCGSPSPSPMSTVANALLMFLCRIGGRHMRVRYQQKLISNRYNKRFRSEGPQAWTCSDPEVRQTFAADPRCNFTITADCASTLMSLLCETYSPRGWNPKNPDMPVVFLSGEDDPCMINNERFDKSVDCMHVIGYRDIRVFTYAGMRHEILNELNKKSVWIDILTQIEAE